MVTRLQPSSSRALAMFAVAISMAATATTVLATTAAPATTATPTTTVSAAKPTESRDPAQKQLNSIVAADPLST